MTQTEEYRTHAMMAMKKLRDQIYDLSWEEYNYDDAGCPCCSSMDSGDFYDKLEDLLVDYFDVEGSLFKEVQS